jgi:hypothetical protein
MKLISQVKLYNITLDHVPFNALWYEKKTDLINQMITISKLTKAIHVLHTWDGMSKSQFI